ncbi:MAG: 3'-5' exonuclease [Acidobacteria bacterium]|nr:3'-5' exonuclease [Acidobacteriota bacterium]
MPENKRGYKDIPTSANPIQASNWLGIVMWQFDAAVRRELIPPADLSGRWSAALLKATADRLPMILDQVGEHPPIGANRAAKRLNQQLGLDSDRSDMESLVERNLLDIACYYKGWPLFDVRDLDEFADKHGELLTEIITERKAWQAASLSISAACAQLGWRGEEFEHVVAELGIKSGRFGRFARTDIADLAADRNLMKRVLVDRLLSPDQACEYLEIPRNRFDHLGLAGLILPKATGRVQIGRYKKMTVPLYRIGDLDDLRHLPVLDWQALHSGEEEELSRLRELVASQPTCAQILRRFIAELSDRLGVEVWVYHNTNTEQWEISWEVLEPGNPSKVQIFEAITLDRTVAQFCGNIMLYPETGAVIRWAKDMLKSNAACLVDIETVDTQGPICEIAAIDTANEEVLLDTLVNPGAPISRGAFRIHGISDSDVANAPSWPRMLPKLLRITEGRKILAYNAEYDLRIIRAECCRHNVRPGHLGDRRNWECVMTRRSDWLHTQRWLPLNGRHRALADCLSALGVLRSLAVPPHGNGPDSVTLAPGEEAP